MTMRPRTYRPAHMQGNQGDVRKRARRAGDALRGTAATRGYNAKWTKAALAYRRANPLCVCCDANGFVAAAQMVDHVVPHKGDMAIFWRREDWQSLCWDCHRRVKAVIEARWLRGEAGRSELILSRSIPEFFPVC